MSSGFSLLALVGIVELSCALKISRAASVKTAPPSSVANNLVSSENPSLTGTTVVHAWPMSRARPVVRPLAKMPADALLMADMAGT